MITFTIQGAEQALAASMRAYRAVQEMHGLSRVVGEAADALLTETKFTTHVHTGALQASHRMDQMGGYARWQIYIDPSVVNPLGERPAEYGPIEHARGGDHEFYRRAIEEGIERVGGRALAAFIWELG